MRADQIVEGRCYETQIGRVRRVVKVENGKVTFEENSTAEFADSSSGKTIVATDRFAQDAVREVPCWSKNRSAGWT
jgi:hypothetical protein